MNDPSRILQHLAAAARRDSIPPDDLAPGLATRVLARVRDERPAPSLWESSALVALPVAALVTLVCVLLGSPTVEPPEDADTISGLMLESELPPLPEP